MPTNNENFCEQVYVQIVKTSCSICGVWLHKPDVSERKLAYAKWLKVDVEDIEDLEIFTKLEVHNQIPSEKEI